MIQSSNSQSSMPSSDLTLPQTDFYLQSLKNCLEVMLVREALEKRDQEAKLDHQVKSAGCIHEKTSGRKRPVVAALNGNALHNGGMSTCRIVVVSTLRRHLKHGDRSVPVPDVVGSTMNHIACRSHREDGDAANEKTGYEAKAEEPYKVDFGRGNFTRDLSSTASQCMDDDLERYNLGRFNNKGNYTISMDFFSTFPTLCSPSTSFVRTTNI
ncbi:hypothetical protein Sjap_010444 [Stephania japonica]|uniref:Uncharacterized protein n=1 Tax=Stephania japonica TaxID=461633 RepID=A0AAP0J945_9MAGN